MPPPSVRSPAYWGGVAGLACAYWFTGWLAFHLGEPIDYAYKAVLWPPVGLGVAVLLLGGLRLWPGVALGEFLTSTSLGAPRPLATDLLVSAGGTLEVVVAVWLFALAVGRTASLQVPRHALVFTLLSAALAPVIGALAGTLAFTRAGIVASSDFGYVAWAWWTGDVVSVLVLAPWLVGWQEPRAGAGTPRSRLEFGVMLAGLMATCGAVFAGWLRPGATYGYPLTYLPVLIVAWMASRFGYQGATTGTVVVAAFAVWGTLHGLGPFVQPTRFETVLMLQAFLATVAAAMLVVNAVVLGHRRSEVALARHEAELRQAEALERVKDEILDATTHELRTPIAVIKGNAELLEELAPADEARPLVRAIQEGVHRLEHQVDDLLLIGAVAAGTLHLRPHEADLARLAEDRLAAWHDRAAARHVELVLERPEGPVWAWLDDERVGQALERLLDNALKFTPTGGTVTVAVVPQDERVRLEVRDTGAGIPADRRAHLFERFFQADPSLTRTHGGAGLGLAIVKAIAEAHGGSVGVESQLGRGSRFWLTLPARPRGVGVTFMPSNGARREG